MNYFFFNTVSEGSGEIESKYILVYKNLYDYGGKYSDTLQLYVQLKANGKNVVLASIDQLKTMKVTSEDRIIVIESNFTSQEYENIIDHFGQEKVIIHNNGDFPTDNRLENPRLLIGIDKVYPFSDLNKLMDIAEDLNSKGIQFNCIIMPIYENYELDAYDKFIEVLKYVGKKGGQFFIHFPVVNEDGTYNLDPRDGFEKSIEKYRDRGIEIKGIKISQDRLFTDTKVFEGLNLPFLLVTEQETKVNVDSDFLEISEKINKHIFIQGNNIDGFNIFSYMTTRGYIDNQLIYFNINDDIKKLNDLINVLYKEHISIGDFQGKDFNPKLRDFEFEGEETVINVGEQGKSQLEKFKDQELKKIKGENLEGEKEKAEGYDISKIVKRGINLGFFIVLIFIIQILIGRRFNMKKFLKK